jgi:hypothetical protein
VGSTGGQTRPGRHRGCDQAVNAGDLDLIDDGSECHLPRGRIAHRQPLGLFNECFYIRRVQAFVHRVDHPKIAWS